MSNVCAKPCNECPFSDKSLSGWLASYSIEDFIDMQRTEVPFPCHKMMTSEGLSVNQVSRLIKSGELKICRGYIESIIKSCKRPYMNSDLIKAVELVKAEGTSEETMAIWDFKKHHEKFGGSE